MTNIPPRRVCPMCGYDDDITVMPGDDDDTWAYTCLSDRHTWIVKAPTGIEGRNGIMAELGLYDDLLRCLVSGESWVEHGIVEHRYKEAFPDVYFNELLPRYGHVATHGSKRYTASAFIASALGRLRVEGALVQSRGPATGFWHYNGSVSYWALPPGPGPEDRTTWESFARERGLDPKQWSLIRVASGGFSPDAQQPSSAAEPSMAPAVQKGQGEGSRTDDIRHADPNIDNRRRGRFHVGWKDAADRGKTYGETALARLTWQNVGWRLGDILGPTSAPMIDDFYDLCVLQQRDAVRMIEDADDIRGIE